MNTILERVHPIALRSLSAVSLHKVVQMAGLAITVALVPRLFGAEDYGRFAFLLSLSYLAQILGDFGTLDVMGRFVPSMTSAEAGRLYMRTLAFKIVVGVLCGIVTVGAAFLLSRWMRFEWALLTGLSVALHIIAWVPFQFSLGLNWVGTWIAEQAWRQWVLLGLLLALLPFLGLSGALLALVLMEAIFCVLGLWWVRDYWRITELRFDKVYLWPYIRFGTGFFLANLAGVALYRSGPVLVETLTGQSAQAGYLNLALGLFLLAYVTFGQFSQSLIPTLSGFWSRGETEQMQQWLSNFVRYSWLIGWLGTILVWLLADWSIPLLFGADFASAATAMKWISLGVPLSALLWTGNVVATVTGQGKVKFGASLVALLLFLTITIWLAPTYGAAGTALALSLAIGANMAILNLFLQPDFILEWPILSFSAMIGGGILGMLGWLS